MFRKLLRSKEGMQMNDFVKLVIDLVKGALKIRPSIELEESGTSMPRREGMKGFYGEPSEGREGIVGGVAKALVKELTGKPAEIVETKVKLADKLGSGYRDWETDRKSTRLNSSHSAKSRMPSSA